MSEGLLVRRGQKVGVPGSRSMQMSSARKGVGSVGRLLFTPRGLGGGLGGTALSPRDPSVTATPAGWSGAPPTGWRGLREGRKVQRTAPVPPLSCWGN